MPRKPSRDICKHFEWVLTVGRVCHKDATLQPWMAGASVCGPTSRRLRQVKTVPSRTYSPATSLTCESHISMMTILSHLGMKTQGEEEDAIKSKVWERYMYISNHVSQLPWDQMGA